MKHSKRHTPDSFSKKINIDQLRTIMIICHWKILVWPQIFESACDANTTVTNGLPDANTPEYWRTSQVFDAFANPWLCITLVFCSIFKLEQLRTLFAFKNMTRNAYLVPEIQFAYSWTWSCFIYYWMITLLRRSDALGLKDSPSHRVYT